MKKFALIFRMDSTSEDANPSKEQMEIYMEQWMEWIHHISENGHLAEGGNHFSQQGKVIRPNQIQDSIYTANNEYIAGYIIVIGKDVMEAVNIGKKCPILNGEGTSVEVREIQPPGMQ